MSLSSGASDRPPRPSERGACGSPGPGRRPRGGGRARCGRHTLTASPTPPASSTDAGPGPPPPAPATRPRSRDRDPGRGPMGSPPSRSRSSSGSTHFGVWGGGTEGTSARRARAAGAPACAASRRRGGGKVPPRGVPRPGPAISLRTHLPMRGIRDSRLCCLRSRESGVSPPVGTLSNNSARSCIARPLVAKVEK